MRTENTTKKRVLVSKYQKNLYICILFLCGLLLTPAVSEAKKVCADPDKFPVCHAGSENNPNYVNICVDFAALWGHFSNHSLDYYGECLDASADIIAYTCNAGLSFSPSNQKICRDIDTNSIVPNCNDSRNCVCSNDPVTETQYQRNYFKYLIAPFFEGDQFYIDEFDFQTLGYTEHSALSGYGIISQAAPVVGKSILEPNASLQFHFGSERFGNKYFVDTCFRYVGDLPTNSKLTVKHQNTIISENSSLYRQKAQLKQKYELFCDHSTDTTTNFSVSANPVASTVLSSYNGMGVAWQEVIPAKKFCFIRTTLTENENQTELRPNRLQMVAFQNQTEVTLKDFIPTGNDLPVNVCYVQNSNGCCQDVTLTTQSDFRNFIVATGNTGQRNSSYRGACTINCKKLCK